MLLRPHFKKSVLATVATLALTPCSSWALNFADAPPGTRAPYVAPNVILSLDDSTSMNANMFDAQGNNLGWRTTVLKNAVIDTFSDTTLLPDGKIRLAWQTMGNCTTVNGQKWAQPLLATSATTNAQKNTMRVLEGTHRANFLTYMNNYSACTNTPTHTMVQRADAYMRAGLHQNGPWASKPGDTGQPYLGCRRNYHILLTDGGWNAGYVSTPAVDYDRGNRTLPDGTLYDTTNPQTRVYRGDRTEWSTLADWAMYSWAAPLQPAGSLDGVLATTAEYNTAPATETVTNRITGESFTFDKYWNPKYDPATWPHLTTFTIGFSNDALPKRTYTRSGNTFTNRGIAPVRPTSMLPYGSDGDLAGFANETIAWNAVHEVGSPNYPLTTPSDRGHDMWHAAINGRGQFYAVERGEDLKQAFRQIVQQINTNTEPDLGSVATSGTNATRNDVGRFSASYDPSKFWMGAVTAELIKNDGSTAPNPAWAGKSTADLLDQLGSVTNRLILSWSDFSSTGVSFEWAADQSYLSTAQKNWLDLDSSGIADGKGQQRLEYLRGDRSMEGTASPANYPPAKPFRERKSRQGDIVNSEVWYVGAPNSNYAYRGYAGFTRTNKNRQPMLYVGGNDGMLHGFSAADGTEKIAYVPRGVIPGLAQLTRPAYNNHHKYFVDGSPFSGDVDFGVGDPYDGGYVPDWHTVLVGTLGAGGKGFFVLDITNPGTTSGVNGNFDKANAQALVLMDKTQHASETVASVADCENASITPAAQKEICLAAADMGHIFAKPVLDDNNPQRTTQIARLNNNRWGVVFGNGYNSKSERPVLLIQYLDGDKRLVRLVATGTTPTGSTPDTTENGLSAPRLVDINGDGRPDVVYAGDIKGNLWKFLIADDNDSNWGVAQWGANAGTTNNHSINGQPLYTAKGGTLGSPNQRTLRQPIVVPPTVRPNDRRNGTVRVGGMMVAFGTGRNITETDPLSNDKQTLYSVLDNTRYKLVGTPSNRRVAVCASMADPDCQAVVLSSADLPARIVSPFAGAGPLAQQNISSSKVNTRDGRDFWTVDVGTAVDWSVHKGWYLDLPETGERLLKPMGFFDSSNLLTVYSQVPAKGSRAEENVESCESGTPESERQYLTLLNIMDGKRPSVQILDTDGNGVYGSSDQGASRMSLTKGAQTMVKVGNKIVNYGDKVDGLPRTDVLAPMPELALRPSWRQLR